MLAVSRDALPSIFERWQFTSPAGVQLLRAATRILKEGELQRRSAARSPSQTTGFSVVRQRSGPKSGLSFGF